MPSVSRNQQIVAAIAKNNPSKLYPSNQGIAKMKKSDLNDFASTPTKNLPKKISGKSVPK
jgi:hypothetical protein